MSVGSVRICVSRFFGASFDRCRLGAAREGLIRGEVPTRTSLFLGPLVLLVQGKQWAVAKIMVGIDLVFEQEARNKECCHGNPASTGTVCYETALGQGH